MQPRAEPPAMAGYGVGKDDWIPLPWSWAATRLDRERNPWLCTATPDGRPDGFATRATRWTFDR